MPRRSILSTGLGPPQPAGSRRRARALVVTALALAVAAVFAAPARAGLPSPPAGWTLAFGDDFEGSAGSLPSSSDWRLTTGTSYPGGPPNWGTGEVTVYTGDPANVSLDGEGHLRITPRRDAGGVWTSARVETNRQDLRPPEGGTMRIESRLAMPDVTPATGGLGYWPAFWILGSPYRGNWQNWPSVGEIDIMESVNGLDRVWGVLHCGTVQGGPCNEPNGIGADLPCTGAPCPGNFHEYAFEWDESVSPAELRWYLNGEQYHGVSEADLPAAAWEAMATHDGYFMILNVAIGGGFPSGVAGFSTPIGSTAPDRPMLVDYVAVWYRGDGPEPIDPPTLAGTGNPGTMLTCERGTWTEHGTDAYVWRRDGERIETGMGEGETGSTNPRRYRASADHAGSEVVCQVIRTSASGTSAPATSNAVTLQGAPVPENTEPPTLTGSGRAGTMLTCERGEWTGGGSYAFAWLLDGEEVEVGTGAGQTGSTNPARYRAKASEVGLDVACVVTRTNAHGTSAPAHSGAVRVGDG